MSNFDLPQIEPYIDRLMGEFVGKDLSTGRILWRRKFQGTPEDAAKVLNALQTIGRMAWVFEWDEENAILAAAKEAQDDAS